MIKIPQNISHVLWLSAILIMYGLLFAWTLTTPELGRYPLDDAYIVDHAVAGIAAGHETRFMGSTPWLGVTSPVFTELLALLALLVTIPVGHAVLSIISAVSFVAGLYVYGRQKSLHPLFLYIFIATVVFSGSIFFQLLNGIETALAMSGVIWSFFVLEYASESLFGYILIGALYFIRPELGVLSAIFTIQIFYKKSPGWHKKIAVISTTALVLSLAQYQLSGQLLPNTVNAKVFFFAEGCRSAAFKSDFMFKAIHQFLGSLELVSFGFVLLLLARSRLAIAVFMCVFAFAYYLWFPGALYHNHFRYLSIFVPLCWIGWIAGLTSSSQSVRFLSFVLAIVASLATLPDMVHTIQAYREETATLFQDNYSMAEWVSRHVPPKAIILIHDAGLISTIGTQPLIDLVGLKSPSASVINKRILYKECRRDPAALNDIALQGGASYLIVDRDWDRIFKLTSALQTDGWRVQRVDVERGKSFYEVFHITPPTGSMPPLVRRFQFE